MGSSTIQCPQTRSTYRAYAARAISLSLGASASPAGLMPSSVGPIGMALMVATVRRTAEVYVRLVKRMSPLGRRS